MATWTMGVIESTGYFGLTALMFLENVFPPIPSEVVMPLAGYMVARGKLSLVGVIVAGMLGSVLGALPLYYLGRVIDRDRVRDLAARHGRWWTVSPRDLDNAQAWFERHGGAAVLLCRLVPGIRSLISIPAAVADMPLGSFLAFTALGTAAWSSLLATAGFLLGSRFTVIEGYLDPIAWGVAAIVVGLYLYRVARHRGVD